MTGIKHIFFDLDNTLWDFEKSSMATLQELFDKYELPKLGVSSFESFVAAYQHRNELLWEQYRLGAIDKLTLRNKRFAFTFWDMGLDPDTAPHGLADDYVYLGPRKKPSVSAHARDAGIPERQIPVAHHHQRLPGGPNGEDGNLRACPLFRQGNHQRGNGLQET